MVAEAGGDTIRCAEYATYGSKALADNALKALADRTACLLANHGCLVLGESLTKTMQLAANVEELAAQYCVALKIGQVTILSDEQMVEVLKKFKHYGQQS